MVTKRSSQVEKRYLTIAFNHNQPEEGKSWRISTHIDVLQMEIGSLSLTVPHSLPLVWLQFSLKTLKRTSGYGHLA